MEEEHNFELQNLLKKLTYYLNHRWMDKIFTKHDPTEPSPLLP